jgi:hypothetical protein
VGYLRWGTTRPNAEKDTRLKIFRADVADLMMKQLTSDEYALLTPGLSY